MLTIDPDTTKIPLGNNLFAMVSNGDLQKIQGRNWRHSSMTNSGKFYARRFEKGGYVLLHRLLMGLPNGDKRTVDHINGDSLDNRRENLRICTAKENSWNRRKTNSVLGYFGVSNGNGPNQYVSKFRHDGKNVYVGTFDTAIEAAYEYNKVAKKLRGEFAALNQIDILLLRQVLTQKVNSLQNQIEAVKGDLHAIA